MSKSLNALYTIAHKGSTYMYYPSYHDAELATNILHEVVVYGINGKQSRTSVDFNPNMLMSRNSFFRWIDLAMPNREEYCGVFKADEEECIVPLNAEMIDQLYEFYKHN